MPFRNSAFPPASFWRFAYAAICEEASSVGLPIVSIDTKKKEMLGNFKREGKALSNGPLKSLDHDFSTFSDGQIVPHGIYDVPRNVGYMTLGISHDTSKFVCDNIARVWREYLKEQYPDARTLVILCDDHFLIFINAGKVKLSFYRPENPVKTMKIGWRYNNLKTPTLQELLGMKLFALCVRTVFRDYYDIYCLLEAG